MSKNKNILIDSDSRRGAYEMHQTRAIVQHHTHGRLLLVEGFGGMDSVIGGAYRFRHGCCYSITESDTVESLFDDSTESGFSDFDSLCPLEFSGAIVAKIAESVGL